MNKITGLLILSFIFSTASAFEILIDRNFYRPLLQPFSIYQNIKIQGFELDSILGWEGQEDLNFDSKRTFQYNEDTIISIFHERMWGVEIPLLLFNQVYDISGRNTFFDHKIFGEYPTIKEINKYNSNNTLSRYSYHHWNNKRQEIIEIIQYNYLYDETGMMTDGYGSLKDTTTYKNHDIRIIPSGTMQDLEIVYHYQIENNWEPYQKTQQQFDNQMNLLSQITSSWDNEEWINKKKSTYIYNSDNQIIQEVHYTYENDLWIEIHKYESSYDDELRLIRTVEYTKDSTDISIRKIHDNEYVYHNGLIFSSFQNKFNSGGNIEQTFTSYYYCSPKTTSLNQIINESEVIIYPNPATDFIKIDIKENENAILNIYSTSGNKVLTEPIISGKTISVQNLLKGLYIYEVQIDKQNKYGKIIIK